MTKRAGRGYLPAHIRTLNLDNNTKIIYLLLKVVFICKAQLFVKDLT